MQKHGGILNTDCWVKEASLKRLHSVWFYLNDILEKANYIVGKKISSCHGPGESSRGVNEARSWGWWNYSVWCRHGRYTKLCIFQNSQNSTAQIAKRCVQFFLKNHLKLTRVSEKRMQNHLTASQRHETISLKGVGMKACTGQRNLLEQRLRHHELNTRTALQVLTLFPVWDELTIWNHSPGMGKSRFTAVSVRNRVYSCFIIYYYCIIYLYYNCKPTLARPWTCVLELTNQVSRWQTATAGSLTARAGSYRQTRGGAV